MFLNVALEPPLTHCIHCQLNCCSSVSINHQDQNCVAKASLEKKNPAVSLGMKTLKITLNFFCNCWPGKGGMRLILENYSYAYTSHLEPFYWYNELCIKPNENISYLFKLRCFQLGTKIHTEACYVLTLRKSAVPIDLGGNYNYLAPPKISSFPDEFECGLLWLS